ncbi:MAG: xylanase deacetylase [Thermobacillus sp. ZCTH02-B1]|uniref:polysaccharide deacetylase family protein n=1 Tax=Thermobacillus sp. ZCTH02-B1 TaxID=1858795 RepID=UPI000B54F7E4|nr:polysaccharide deacetylase family protein [Thermobacillus sp. ZCTH02-B1]OUM96037.1 MAG: xylanase deacetylase [Thermobacillus sp. ZCTH02-B1]
MENMLLWVFYFLTFYAFLPGFISRAFGFRVFKRGRTLREIALTFDDGPDPVYTPRLLDLLRKYGAKATFFVVGAHAERHPELLRRMAEEGHTIGIHNYVHKTNWLMRPGTVKRQIARTSEIIEREAGVKPIYYRPPWGIVNLFDYANLGHLQIILWSAMFGDWRKRVGVERLTARMLKKLRPGEVLLLHDCGRTFGADEDAPENMLQALEVYLRRGSEMGYRFVTIGEMIALTDRNRAREMAEKGPGFIRRTAAACWMVWERCFNALFRIVDPGDDSLLHYRIRPYAGPELRLDDGTVIRPKDRIVELHFDNAKLRHLLANARSVVKVAIALIRDAERSLPTLARHLERCADLRGVKALYGVSLIHRGPEAFGFSVFDLPRGPFRFFTTRYLRLLIRVLNPNGRKLLRDKEAQFHPRIMAMSLDGFLRRYGSAADEAERKASGKLGTAAGAVPADGAGAPVLTGGNALPQ